MSELRILYYDLETKDIIKIVREVDSKLNDPYFEIPYEDIKEFIDRFFVIIIIAILTAVYYIYSYMNN